MPLGRQAEGKLDNLPVEKRGPCFQGIRHRCPVYLGQYILGQINQRIAGHHAAEGIGLGLLWNVWRCMAQIVQIGNQLLECVAGMEYRCDVRGFGIQSVNDIAKQVCLLYQTAAVVFHRLRNEFQQPLQVGSKEFWQPGIPT